MQKTQALLDAGLTLFLARGLESVTIDEIVEEAGVPKGSFYRYLDGKDALVAALFAPLRERVTEAFSRCERGLAAADSEETHAAAYRDLAEHLAAGLLQSPQLVRLYLQECRGPAAGARRPVRALADAVAAGAIELTAVAHARGLLRPFEGRVSALAVVGAVEKLMFEVLSGADVGDVFAVPDALISLVLDGLRPRSSG